MTTEKAASGPAAGALGRVNFLDGQNDMPMLEVVTPWSQAEIYLHGAHVTQFRKKDDAPLLFLSQCSRFEAERPIRGGIPIIFPWFGPREGMGQHGFARVKDWELKEVVCLPDGSVGVQFHLPDCAEASAYPPFSADYRVTVNQALTLALNVKNESQEDEFELENCLHTYFEVGDVTAISVTGLKGVTYLDQVAGFAQKVETNEAIRFASEVDRMYLNTPDTVEIHDPRLGRKVLIEKRGSVSTVVWNPWIAKAHQMPDFGNDEYERMVCVESGNVGPNGLKLAPGQTATLTVKLSSQALS
jgi:glucose-6-phosphate 1-epimerase